MRSLAAIMRNGDKDATRVSAAAGLVRQRLTDIIRSRTRAKTARHQGDPESVHPKSPQVP